MTETSVDEIRSELWRAGYRVYVWSRDDYPQIGYWMCTIEKYLDVGKGHYDRLHQWRGTGDSRDAAFFEAYYEMKLEQLNLS